MVVFAGGFYCSDLYAVLFTFLLVSCNNVKLLSQIFGSSSELERIVGLIIGEFKLLNSLQLI